jgi:hypothetical protein
MLESIGESGAYVCVALQQAQTPHLATAQIPSWPPSMLLATPFVFAWKNPGSIHSRKGSRGRLELDEVERPFVGTLWQC